VTIVFSHLQHIYDPRERLLVGLADLGLTACTWPWKLVGHPRVVTAPRRILLFRLERIGDLLMTLSALESARATWPDARIDLLVGSWNADLARLFPWIDRVDVFDAPWLARGTTGARAGSLLDHARRWRREHYDLAINLEGDIRSNVLMALSGAPVRVGFAMAGGRAALTDVVEHDSHQHTDENTRRLVRAAAARLGSALVEPSPGWPRFALPSSIAAAADALLGGDAVRDRPLIGLHPSGGRAIKQWHPERFAEAVTKLARDVSGTIVLTGTAGDRALVQATRAMIPAGQTVIDLAGPLDLPTLSGVLSRLDLYVTGDTGPMHLAAAMGTPTVGVFGISDPARYAPLVPHRRIVRIDLPCSPCNRVRLPPERCRGHVPDCLEGISVDMVYRAARDLLAEVEDGRRRSRGTPDPGDRRDSPPASRPREQA
jgi:lipopolysaccharide heptosyltransferase II